MAVATPALILVPTAARRHLRRVLTPQQVIRTRPPKQAPAPVPATVVITRPDRALTAIPGPRPHTTPRPRAVEPRRASLPSRHPRRTSLPSRHPRRVRPRALIARAMLPRHLTPERIMLLKCRMQTTDLAAPTKLTPRTLQWIRQTCPPERSTATLSAGEQGQLLATRVISRGRITSSIDLGRQTMLVCRSTPVIPQ